MFFSLNYNEFFLFLINNLIINKNLSTGIMRIENYAIFLFADLKVKKKIKYLFEVSVSNAFKAGNKFLNLKKCLFLNRRFLFCFKLHKLLNQIVFKKYKVFNLTVLSFLINLQYESIFVLVLCFYFYKFFVFQIFISNINRIILFLEFFNFFFLTY